MRTSVDIPDELHRQLKTEAARRGISLKQLLIASAVREIEPPQRKPYRVKLPLVKSKKPGTLRITNKEIDDLLA